MTILEKIILHKRKEVHELKNTTSIKKMENSIFFERETLSLIKNLKEKKTNGIIAEFKRQSPSKGIINATAKVDDVVQAYMKNNAAAASILTDEYFFGGKVEDLISARQHYIPILRKEFIIDEFQIIQAKSIGADVILLIASCLTVKQVKDFTNLATSLGLEVLLELQDEKEMNHMNSNIQLIGINNRNLKTFEVNIENSLQMVQKIPKECIKIAESGISKIQDVILFKQNNFDGFLIGELFMKEKNPAAAFNLFTKQLLEYEY